MWDKFKKWWDDTHAIRTHTIAVATTALTGYWVASAEFRNQVTATYDAIHDHLPAWLRPWVPLALGLYTFYRNSQKSEPKGMTNPQAQKQL